MSPNCARYADPEGIAVIEDAAQAHGATLAGTPVGGLGTVGCFSFYPSKNLGALGDGGAVVTNVEDIAERVRLLHDLGQRRKYQHVLAGANERLDGVQAAVLRVKLRRLDEWNRLRQQVADRYTYCLADVVDTPRVESGRTSVWHLYVIRVDERDARRESLDASGIATGLHYPLPLHLQPPLEFLGHTTGSFPAAEAWSSRGLSLPMFPELEDTEVESVVKAVTVAMGV